MLRTVELVGSRVLEEENGDNFIDGDDTTADDEGGLGDSATNELEKSVKATIVEDDVM